MVVGFRLSLTFGESVRFGFMCTYVSVCVCLCLYRERDAPTTPKVEAQAGEFEPVSVLSHV